LPLDFAHAPHLTENNLRLPDAITITHGPRRLLARFILEADKAAREMGLFLRVRNDFDELLFLNRAEAARGNWYPLVDMFNPERVQLNAQNAFWISGENEAGEIVVTFGGRIFDWTGTSLAEQAVPLFYGEDRGQPCKITAEAAHQITGVVLCGLAAWVRPDCRGRQITRLIPRVGKAYACSSWPIDWTFAYLTRKHAEIGMPTRYGHRHVSFSVSYPGTPWVDLAIMFTTAAEVYEDMTDFLSDRVSEAPLAQPGSAVVPTAAAVPTAFEHIVTKTSSEGVFHGSSSLS
jgi:hypothetical protein